MATDLLEERAKRNFDMQEMTVALLGGQKKYDEVMSFYKFGESDPILRNSEKFHDLSREEEMELLLKKARRIYDLDKKTYYEDADEAYFSWSGVLF